MHLPNDFNTNLDPHNLDLLRLAMKSWETWATQLPELKTNKIHFDFTPYFISITSHILLILIVCTATEFTTIKIKTSLSIYKVVFASVQTFKIKKYAEFLASCWESGFVLQLRKKKRTFTIFVAKLKRISITEKAANDKWIPSQLKMKS